MNSRLNFAVVCAVGILALAGCGNGNSGGSGNAADTETTDQFQQKVQTQCSGSSTADSIKGTWYTVRINTHETLTVADSTTTYAVVCAAEGDSATVQVQVPSTFTSRVLSFLSSAHDEKTTGHLNCSVSLPQGQFSYTIMQNCLKVSAGPNALTFLRK